MVTVIDNTGKPPAGAVEGLESCNRCVLSEHTNACNNAIAEITARIAMSFQKKGAAFDLSNVAHLVFLEGTLKKSGLVFNRNDEALMTRAREAASLSPKV